MDGTYPSFASRVSCVAHTLPVDFAVRSAQRCRSRAAARATSTETGGYLPAVSWPLACSRVNLQWATSPMKQEKCIQTGGASDGFSLREGGEGICWPGWRVTLREWAFMEQTKRTLFRESGYWWSRNVPTCASFNARELCWPEYV